MAGSFAGFGNLAVVPSFPDLLAAAKSMQFTTTTFSSAGTTDTITANQIDAGLYVRSGATAAVTATTDTATNIINALGPNATVGQTFVLWYANLNTSSGVVTVAGGTGVTTSGTLTIPVSGLRLFLGTIVTTTPGSQAVSLQSVFSIGSGVAA
jgi:hypothetical protein